MPDTSKLLFDRRSIFSSAGVAIAALSVAGCDSPPAERYSQADIDLLAAQREQEQELRGKGPYGVQIYEGYRGLAELRWFDLDDRGHPFE